MWRVSGAGARRPEAMDQRRRRGRGGHDGPPTCCHRAARGQRRAEHRRPICRRRVLSRSPHARHSGQGRGEARRSSRSAPGDEVMARAVGCRQAVDRGKLRLSAPQPFALRIDGHLARGPGRFSGRLGLARRAADDSAAGDLCYVGQGAASHALSRRLRTVASLEKLSDLELRPDAAAIRLPGSSARNDLAQAIDARLQQARDLSAPCPRAGRRRLPT